MAIRNINAEIVNTNGLPMLPENISAANIMIVLFAAKPLFFITTTNITAHFVVVIKSAVILLML